MATVMSKERQTKEKILHLLAVRKAAGEQGRKPAWKGTWWTKEEREGGGQTNQDRKEAG